MEKETQEYNSGNVNGDVRNYRELLSSDYGEIKFDEETVRAIFGHEAAEDEEIDKLKKYYVRTDIYNSIRSNISLYILVGHKGVGKSALFKVLAAEDDECGNIAISIQPDSILNIKTNEMNFLQMIRDWKKGLYKIIFNELLSIMVP